MDKIQSMLDDPLIYFWKEDVYWNLWYKITLLSFLGKHGIDMLQEVLTIRDNALLVPLIKGLGDIDGFALIIKNEVGENR
jgi:hypothetical protein